MNARTWLLVPAASLLAVLALDPSSTTLAQSQGGAPSALTGVVSSADEPAMEGVLVTVKQVGAKRATTVVTGSDGRYQFPRARLEPGSYAVSIRAIGYDLASDATATVSASGTTTADLTLRKAHSLAAQLTNAEWLASFPGTDQQKASVRNCAHCHTLELVTNTKHSAESFTKVIERMTGYPPLAFPLMLQRTPATRIGPGAVSREQQLQTWRTQAEYLSTLNLGTGTQWNYPFKTFPRPSGEATRVVYTEYDLPARTRQPHDVIVDSKGTVWYAAFGEQIIGKMDPATGAIAEFTVPTLKPAAPKGILGMRFDEDENLWLALQFQGGVAKFDTRTEKFQVWSLPPHLNGDHVQINQVSPGRHKVDGKVWLQDAGTYTVLRLDVKSGQFEVFSPFEIPRPNVYDVIPDKDNNGWYLPLGAEEVGRIDAETGAITRFKTPTEGSGPRRGMMDSLERLWFGENRGDRIGMFDTRTQQFQEWQPKTPGWPYDVIADRTGEAWAGNEFNDRIVRLNPVTGRMIEYLLPRQTNVRRVWVDNRTNPVTFWVGNNHGASIVKLEPLD
jgi:streptogramin lyase